MITLKKYKSGLQDGYVGSPGIQMGIDGLAPNIHGYIGCDRERYEMVWVIFYQTSNTIWYKPLKS